MQGRGRIDENIQWGQIQKLNVGSMAIFAQESRVTVDGTVQLSRIEKDFVFGPEVDGQRVSNMTNKQRSLVNECVDEVNVQERR